MSNVSTTSDPPAVSATTSSISGTPSSPIRGAPPSPHDIGRAPSSPSTTRSTTDQPQPSTPARDLAIPNLSVEQDLLGLGDYEVTIHDDDTAPSSGDDSNLNNNIVITSSDAEEVEEEDNIYGDSEFKPLIYSYLLKLGRNDKWQRRFFECDGASLTYFKTERRLKKLATLDLAKVRILSFLR